MNDRAMTFSENLVALVEDAVSDAIKQPLASLKEAEEDLFVLSKKYERVCADRDALLAAAKNAVGALQTGWKLGPEGQVCTCLKTAIAQAEESAA